MHLFIYYIYYNHLVIRILAIKLAYIYYTYRFITYSK